MVLGAHPTPQDAQVGKPFTGNAGKELDRLMYDAGIHKPNCWFTNVSKYPLPPLYPGQKIPFWKRCDAEGINVNEQLAELQNEINSIRPNCILALGGVPLWALTGIRPKERKKKGQDEEMKAIRYGGIGNFRGSIMWGMGCKMVPTYDPAHLLWQTGNPEFKGYWNRQIMIFDFKRALAQSRFPELMLPKRTLEICKNSWHFKEFLDRYKSHRRMAVDIEAMGTCLPACIGLAFNRSHGMTVPLWNKDGISTIPDADLVQIWIMLAEVLYEKDIVGQNFNYDRDKIKRLGFIIRNLVSDTMLKAHAINPELPKGLAFNTSIFTEEPFYKDEGMYSGTIQDLLTGCARDACVTIEVDESMDADVDELGQREFFENFLMKIPDVYWDIERQGFRMDNPTRDELLRKYIKWDEKCRYELFHLTGAEINVGSPKQIQALLWDNLKFPRKDTTGEEDVTALLNQVSVWNKRPEWHRRVLELILEDRRVRKSIGTYLMALPDYDGRMRTTYFPCLDTGRTSTGQQEEPIRPEIEVIDENGKKKSRVLGTAFQTMTKHGDIGQDIRGMYVPDDCHIEVFDTSWGKHEALVYEEEVFVQADSSQAEARVVFKLATDEEALLDLDRRDYHAWTASWFFGGSESDYSKKVLGYEHPIRFAGKTLRHAGHLGAGKRRAAISVNTDARKYKIPLVITEAIAEQALKIFHYKQPKIQKVFQGGVVEALKRNRTLIAGLPYGIEAPCGGRRTFFERMGEDLFRQGFSYIPQRSVSDNTKAAAMRIRARIPGIKIVMESHDALLFSIPLSKLIAYCQIIKEEMERPIDFSHCTLSRTPLIIPCEIETGKNYCDLKKFKDLPIIMPPVEIPKMPPRSITEAFIAQEVIPQDSKLTDVIYHHTVRKKFEVD